MDMVSVATMFLDITKIIVANTHVVRDPFQRVFVKCPTQNTIFNAYARHPKFIQHFEGITQ